MVIDKNRFSGFSKLYNENRPKPPEKVVEIISVYKKKIDTVVDLGAGTGLSTVIWNNKAKRVIGIEPTEDMRKEAMKKYQEIAFLDGSSYNTGLDDNSIDVITCSQSFHWMEPNKTIEEIYRILKTDGILAIYDCKWPVIWSWQAEEAYKKLIKKAKEIYKEKLSNNKRMEQFPKEKHLENLEKSNRFRYCNQIYFDNYEKCDSNRFISIALSQGLIQDVLKENENGIRKEIEEFKEICMKIDQDSMYVSYILNIGIK